MKTQAEKRRLRYAAAQAALTPEELEIQRLQDEAPSERPQRPQRPRGPLSNTTVNILRAAKRWFIEFMRDQHPQVDVTSLYFTPGASPPELPLLKEYARHLVRTRVGRQNGKLSINTIDSYMRMVISVIEQ
jgi:hypothetical protein